MRPTITVTTLWVDYRNGKMRQELRSDWAVTVFYRWPSMLLIAPLARLGVAPATITWVALAVALSMLPVSALLAPPLAGPVLAGLAVAFQVLDCVDGGLARATGRTSASGAAFDFVVDMAQWALLYASVGVLADRSFDTGYLWTAVGLAAGWARLFARVVRDAGQQSGAVPKSGGDRPGRMTTADVFLAFLSGLSGAIPLLLVAALFFDALAPLLVFVLVYGVGDIAEGLAGSFKADPSDVTQ